MKHTAVEAQRTLIRGGGRKGEGRGGDDCFDAAATDDDSTVLATRTLPPATHAGFEGFDGAGRTALATGTAVAAYC
jgi:hypothetical protein